MNTDNEHKNILDNFIDKELEIKPNPFLAAKVMNRIANQSIKDTNEFAIATKEQPLFFNLAMAISVAAVLALGLFLGSSYNNQGKYHTQNNNSIALIINDTQLENLYLYNIDE